MKAFPLTLFALALMTSGCGGGPKVQSSASLTVTHDTEMPAPSGDEAGNRNGEQLLGPLDKLSVSVFGAPDLNLEEVQVDAGGKIYVPLAGQIQAANQTPSEIARAIEAGLRRKFVRDPQVTVGVREVNSQTVTVDGQVGQPGLYPVSGQSTLMRSIATARGTGEFAKLNDVVVLRTVNGQRMAGLFNLAAIRAGAYADPRVYPNDVIVVGDSPARRLFKDFVSVTPLLSAPLIALLQNH